MGIDQLFTKTKKLSFFKILKANRALRASVFGSFARGDARLASDIDLLVDFDKGADLFDQAALVDDLGRFFGRKVDVLTRASLSRHLARNILKDAVPIV